MKVGVIQSNYIPWRGYFDFISSVDRFVIYDDVQYSKGSWRNRNQLRYPDGLKWITLPVKVNLGMNINEVKLKDDSWRKSHKDQLKASLGKTPHFKDVMAIWEQASEINSEYLTEINISFIKTICTYLGIKTEIVRSEPYQLSGTKTERLMELFTKLGATKYLSGPAAESYLDLDLFRKNNIDLYYKAYDYKPYAQQFPGFEPAVTVLDLIANLGQESVNFFKSTTADKPELICS
jgi:hypothetical protein